MREKDSLDMDIVIESERDRRTLEYMISVCGIARVRSARAQLSGHTRPYVSNVAKILGVTIPIEIEATPRDEAQKRIGELRDRLSKHKWD